MTSAATSARLHRWKSVEAQVERERYRAQKYAGIIAFHRALFTALADGDGAEVRRLLAIPERKLARFGVTGRTKRAKRWGAPPVSYNPDMCS